LTPVATRCYYHTFRHLFDIYVYIYYLTGWLTLFGLQPHPVCYLPWVPLYYGLPPTFPFGSHTPYTPVPSRICYVTVLTLYTPALPFLPPLPLDYGLVYGSVTIPGLRGWFVPSWLLTVTFCLPLHTLHTLYTHDLHLRYICMPGALFGYTFCLH